MDKLCWKSGPYDYKSVMHYGATEWSRSETEPIITAINCAPNCPKELGQEDGFSLLDLKKLHKMYQCKPDQYNLFTNAYECKNWPIFNGKKLNCARYVRAGRCKRDSRPCCNCDQEDSGYDAKTYTPKKKRRCRDESPTLCKRAKGGFCFSSFIKSKCSRTCSNNCKKTITLDDKLSRKIVRA